MRLAKLFAILRLGHLDRVLSRRSGFQNKAHRGVLGLVIYCQGIGGAGKLRLSLGAPFGSQKGSVACASDKRLVMNGKKSWQRRCFRDQKLTGTCG